MVGKRVKSCTSTGGGSKGRWLPVEITGEILKRLSTAASIGRFLCVSKSWYSLLSDPNFIRKETQLFNDHGTIDDDKRARLVIIYDALSSAVSLSYHTLEPISPVLNLADLIPDIKLGRGVGGCCDGIFCFFERDSASNIVLWNPTTCDYRVLPSLSQVLGSRGIEKINVGFGYDPLTNDYKVVALVEFASGGGLDGLDAYESCSVYLYSLRNNSWKALCDLGDAYIHALLEVLQSRYSSAKTEICYWWCWHNSDGRGRVWLIASFDLSKHVFNTVELPRLPSHSYSSITSVSMSQDYLMCVTKDGRDKTSYVWSLNYDMLDRGGECCWIKLYTVVNSRIYAGIWEHRKCFGKDSNGQLHVVDLHSDGHSKLELKVQLREVCVIIAYIPSPMSLSSRWWANECLQHDLCLSNL